MKSCAFLGDEKDDYIKYQEYIGILVAELVEEQDYTQFYSADESAFDLICMNSLRYFVERYPIKNTLVNVCPSTDEEEYGLPPAYHESVYLLDKPMPFRRALIKTYKAMIDRVDTVLVAVNRRHGLAWRAVRYARRKKKRVINIYDGYTKEWEEHMETARWFRKMAGLPDPEELQRQKIEKFIEKINGR